MALACGEILVKGAQTLKAAALLFYLVWQTWPYQRQNFGVPSFMMRAGQQVPLNSKERLPIQLAVIAGTFALVKLYDLGHGLVEPPVVHAIRLAVACLHGVVILVALALAFSNRHHRGAEQRMTVIGLGTLFVAPSFLYGYPIDAVLSYALATGCDISSSWGTSAIVSAAD
jgi:hypothetical protein